MNWKLEKLVDDEWWFWGVFDSVPNLVEAVYSMGRNGYVDNVRVTPIDNVKVKLDVGVVKPTRAHKSDAGLDIYSNKSVCIAPHSSELFDTGVHIAIPEGYAGLLKSKSGLNVNHGVVSEGVIDSGYTGSIKVKLYNHSEEPYEVLKDDKISQLVLVPIWSPELEFVGELGETERGENGFGSSGR